MATNQQPTGTGRGRPSGFLARLRGRPRQEPDRPEPWRGEGMPRAPSSREPAAPPPPGGL